ncbi:MAG: Gfo/Idh/MocA family oxidoreductase [Anaerolineaceae bacterium]|nr:Gfo/Idh/MocA family oxidoreductase [Anaerolineaceae bacterium]
METLTLCIIGERGHTNYVLDGLKDLPHARVAGISPGGAAEGVEFLNAALHCMGHEPRLYAEYRQMLDRERPDLLCVIGPFERHAEMCLEAFARGIPVLCEKPVALTLDELARLRDAWQVNPVPFASLMGMRFESPFYTLFQAVKAGVIGDPRLIQAQKSYRLGARPDYYFRRETYGGTIPWVGSHAVDLIHWLSGQRFESVFATHSAQNNAGYGTMEVSAQMQFVLSGGVAASASLDYLRPSGAPSHGDDRARVAGTLGVIEARAGRVWLIDAQGERELALREPPSLLADFVAQVEGSGEGMQDGAQTLAVTEACLLARQSADEGRVVRFVQEEA